jgi:hypothetical protein
VPETLTVVVVPPALIVRVAVRAPVAVGVKITPTVHELSAAMDERHVFFSTKSPLAEIEDTDTAEPVGLETVADCGALFEPVATEPKFSALGATVTPELG